MKERPILFSTPMVQAILEGRKIMTRRILKVNKFPITSQEIVIIEGTFNYLSTGGLSGPYQCPYGEIGDRLWVREAWNTNRNDADNGATNFYCYKADDERYLSRWKPSIHMPREACRLILEITNIRVERLQNISEEDAKAEGIFFNDGLQGYVSDNEGRSFHCYNSRKSFIKLWIGINGEESWEQNPWVWVIEFKKIWPNGK